MVYLETCLREEGRTYNRVQLAEQFKRERRVNLSPDYLRQVLKKRGWFGSARVPVKDSDKTQANGPSNKPTWRCWSSLQLQARLIYSMLRSPVVVCGVPPFTAITFVANRSGKSRPRSGADDSALWDCDSPS